MSGPSDLGQRYLIVGLGSIGRRHLQNLRRMRPASRIAALRRSAGAPPQDCDDVMQNWDEVDQFQPHAAIIASPAPFHAEAAHRLMAKGVPVLIEKPLTHRADEARVLAAAAAETGGRAMVGYNLRFNSAVQAFRDLVHRTEVGEALLVRASVGQFLPDWRPQGDYRSAVSAREALGGGPLLELSHELDLMLWLFGLPSVVHCRGARLSSLEIDVEDAVELTLEYEEPRRLVSVGLDFLQRVPKRACTIVGTLGTLTWNGIRNQVTVERPGRSPEILSFPEERNAMYEAELEHFLHRAEGDGNFSPSLADGVAVMTLVEAARTAMTCGGAVRLEAR